MNNIRKSSDWIRVAFLLSEISLFVVWKTKKLASRTFIHDRHVLKLKRSVLSIKDKSSNLEVRTSIIRTSIIRISRLSGLFLRSQFGHEYWLVTIKIRSHILFKTTALKGAVKCEGFCSQRAKAALALVVSNEERSNSSSDCIRVALLLSEISRSMAWKKKRS